MNFKVMMTKHYNYIGKLQCRREITQNDVNDNDKVFKKSSKLLPKKKYSSMYTIVIFLYSNQAITSKLYYRI